jgi:hypothetical protein
MSHLTNCDRCGEHTWVDDIEEAPGLFCDDCQAWYADRPESEVSREWMRLRAAEMVAADPGLSLSDAEEEAVAEWDDRGEWMNGLLRFQFGGVVAGAEIEAGHVVRAAPVVRKTLGMTLEQVRAQFPAVEWYPDEH